MIRTANTENGQVRGLPAADPRITSFKGIPFAAPPVGDLRWRAPQPCKDWEGIRECFEFAPIPIQDTPGIGDDIYCREWHVDPQIPMSEDCLYLNIWTNAKSTDEKLPVLVWYFGGGFQWGYTSEMEFDGERLARRGIVVVTVSYRLGAFGFLCHPQLTAEQPADPTNFGALDQQAGLRWVKRNIKSFGGDPDNITIAGQSAGGGSVMAQMACKANEGYFSKAAVFSGMITFPYNTDDFFIPQTLEEAGRKGVELFDALGVKTLEEARKLDADFIRRTYSDLRNKGRMFFTIVKDDLFNDGDPMEAFVKGTRNRVPVFAGNTSNEFFDGIRADNTEELEKYVRANASDPEKFLSLDGVYEKSDCGYAAVCAPEVGVKAAFIGESRLPSPEDCYYYRFDPDIPGEDDPGTFHSCDLWFFFETIAKCTRPYTGRHYDIARQMCDYWANFIKTGDPNGYDLCGIKLPEWKKYTERDRNEMVFTSEGAKARIEGDTLTGYLANETADKIGGTK